MSARETFKDLQMKLSLFCSACLSFKYDSVAHPFPPEFKGPSVDGCTTEKHIDQLRELLLKTRVNTMTPEAKKVVSWLSEVLNYKLSLDNLEDFKKIQKQVGDTSSRQTPDYVLSVEYDGRTVRKFDSLKEGKRTMLAYHGSRVENIFSILANGLHTHRNNNALFGPGIYLTTDLNVALTFSPLGKTWPDCPLGEKLQCVLVADIIDDGSVSHKQSPKVQQDSGLRVDFPEEYYVVPSNDLVLVRKILVYSSQPASRLSSTRRFLWTHALWCLPLLYLLVLFLPRLYELSLFKRQDDNSDIRLSSVSFDI